MEAGDHTECISQGVIRHTDPLGVIENMESSLILHVTSLWRLVGHVSLRLLLLYRVPELSKEGRTRQTGIYKDRPHTVNVDGQPGEDEDTLEYRLVFYQLHLWSRGWLSDQLGPWP